MINKLKKKNFDLLKKRSIFIKNNKPKKKLIL